MPPHLCRSSFALATILVAVACATAPRGARSAPEPIATQLAPLPEAVASFGAASQDGWIYVFGGHQGERHEYSAPMVSGALHRLQLANGTPWEALPAAQPAQGASLVAHRQHLYRIGGMAARNQPGEPADLHSQAEVFRFDLGKAAWEPHVPLPKPRSSHDACVLDDALYVGGGWQLAGSPRSGQWHDTLLKLDLTRRHPAWEPIPQPFRRRALAMAGLNHRLYFLGGMSAEGQTLLTVDILDLTRGSWSKGPDLPSGPMKGFGCSAVAHQGRLYVSSMKGELYAWDPAKDAAWTPVGRLQNARFFHRLVPADASHLVAIGGEDSEGKRNDLEILRLSSPDHLAPSPIP